MRADPLAHTAQSALAELDSLQAEKIPWAGEQCWQESSCGSGSVAVCIWYELVWAVGAGHSSRHAMRRSALDCVARRSCLARRSCGAPFRSQPRRGAAWLRRRSRDLAGLGCRRFPGLHGAWWLLVAVGLESRALGWRHAPGALVLRPLEECEHNSPSILSASRASATSALMVLAL